MTQNQDSLRAAGFDFLFRRDSGVISRGLWIRGALALAVPFGLLCAGWAPLLPIMRRTVANLELVDGVTIFAYFYLIVLAFAALFAAICFYNLSAKRFRARGRSPAWAGLSLFGVLSAGAALALQPSSEGIIPLGAAWGLTAAAAAIVLWTIFELAIASDREVAP